MVEKIYTIPVNEAFDLYSGCPICSLYKKLEENEIEIILGAAMMEPDTRIKTNEQGFCGRHYDIMFNQKNRLGLALMLESHLSENIIKTLGGGKAKKLEKQNDSCYVCSRIYHSLGLMTETAALLWQREKEFREKLLPGIYIVFGGPEVSYYEEADFCALYPFVDFLIRGEGEAKLFELCEKLLFFLGV
jgi:hypothetical protein